MKSSLFYLFLFVNDSRKFSAPNFVHRKKALPFCNISSPLFSVRNVPTWVVYEYTIRRHARHLKIQMIPNHEENIAAEFVLFIDQFQQQQGLGIERKYWFIVKGTRRQKAPREDIHHPSVSSPNFFFKIMICREEKETDEDIHGARTTPVDLSPPSIVTAFKRQLNLHFLGWAAALTRDQVLVMFQPCQPFWDVDSYQLFFFF